MGISSCFSPCHRAAPIELPTHAIAAAEEQAFLDSDSIVELSHPLTNEWWTIFQDDQLNQFINTTFSANPTLMIAEAHIRQAAANAYRIGSILYPTLTWGADVSRQKLSTTGVIPFGGTAVPTTSRIPEYFTLYETELNLKYDFDIWGKNRNALRAAIGEVNAKIADESFTRLQLGIAVAQIYYRLQINYARRELGKALIENRTKYYDYITNQVQHNIKDQSSIYLADSDLSDARQSLLQIEGAIAIEEIQLKTYLAGDFSDEINPISIAERPLPQVPLPKDLPMRFLSYRPDIKSQLWLIESAGRQIEVAKAGFYPDFSLIGLFGFQTIHYRELFRWDSTYFNVDPAITLPIFDGGRLRANLQGSESHYDLAIYRYNDLVLNAVKEVLSGIAVLRNRQQQLAETKRHLDSQEGFFSLTSLRVTHNLDSGLTYLLSEQSVLLARDQELIAQGNKLQAILQLIKALGGGYDDCN